MKWSEILTKPTRVIGLISGIALVLVSIFNPISTSLSISTNYDVLFENIGWITIVISLKEMFWNIKTEDLKKFIPLCIIFFVVIFVYTISRQQKDLLVIPAIGAEGAVATKMLVLVFAFIYQYFYTKITRVVSMKNWVYYAILPIVGYFLLFAFVLMNNDSILPSPSSITSWKASMPLLDRFKIIDMLAIWPSILYYIFCEIFAVTVTLVFTWQILNKYLIKEERVRFLSAMMIANQISSLNTGLISKGICKAFDDPIIVSKFINVIILGLTILLFFANHYLFKNIEQPTNETKAKVKTSGSVDIMSIIKNNPIYVLAALLSVYYGLTTVWVEQFWKDKMKILATMRAEELNISSKVIYGQMNSAYITFQSRISILFALLISNFANRIPWIISATCTPFIMLVGSLFIFLSVLFPDFMSMVVPGVGMVTISYYSGFMVLALFKALKYNAFDVSKETYISSKDDDAKREIKNLEGLFGRLGKSGGAILSYLLIVLTGSNFSSKLIGWSFFIACAGISLFWIWSDFKLNEDLKNAELSKNKK